MWQSGKIWSIIQNMLAQRLKRSFSRVVGSRILRDSSALAVSSWVMTGLSLAMSVVLGRTLGATNYGLVILAITVVSTIVQFMDIRTSEGLIKFMGSALVQGNQREAMAFFYVGLSADSALMVVTFAAVRTLAPLASAVYEHGEILQQLSEIFVFTIPFTTLQNSFRSVLTTFKKFWLQAIVDITSSLLLLIILAILSTQGMVAVMWGYVIVAALTFGMWFGLGSLVMLRNFDSFRGQGYRKAWRQFLPFAFHTSLTASLKAILSNAEVLFIGALRPANEVSFYKIARSATVLVTLPITPVRVVIYPNLNEAWASGDLERVKYLVKRFMLYSAAIATGGALLWFVSAYWLVRIFYGVEFLPVVGLIYILAIGTIFGSINFWIRPAALANNKPRLLTYTFLSSAVVNVLMLVLLVPAAGAAGACIAFSIAGVYVTVVGLLILLPALGLWTPFKKQPIL